MKKWILFGLLAAMLAGPLLVQGQQIKGYVQATENGVEVPLIGANVYWEGSTVGTATDLDGSFSIPLLEGHFQLVASYIGYETKIIDISTIAGSEVVFNLNPNLVGKEIEIRKHVAPSGISSKSIENTLNISERELLKAACCNLSESFETTPSVDVAFTDAVTGTREIQMLGLSGPYTLVTRENIPDLRGISAVTGMTYVPGSWIKSIQLTKGTGSVVNGYESIAGQINVELAKPEEMDKLFVNAYGSEGGRGELNLMTSHKISDSWSTAFLLQGVNQTIENDRNKDGFLDSPLKKNFIGINRWKYIGDNGFMFQAALRGIASETYGGQIGVGPNWLSDNRLNVETKWGYGQKVGMLGGWMKAGKVFLEKPWKSFGIQLDMLRQEYDISSGEEYGTNYYGRQQTYYGNFIYQSIINNTNHKFKVGANITYDDLIEKMEMTHPSFSIPVLGSYYYSGGVFAEYTWTPTDKWTIVPGYRVDYRVDYGVINTPRLHLKYHPTEDLTIRFGGGKGTRRKNVISENLGLFASSRNVITSYGNTSHNTFDRMTPSIGSLESLLTIGPEIAWNYGGSITKRFTIDYRDGSIAADFYRTDFLSQYVINWDHPREMKVEYNSNGESYSNSFQAQVDYELIKRLDVRIAYRWFDVWSTYDGKLRQKPLVAEHRAFINLGYKTRDHWAFDLTVNRVGKKRIPDTHQNPVEFQLASFSDPYSQVNVQITKTWREKFSAYVGMENVFNFTQDIPILSASDPSSPYFDASLIWGPIFGRMTYIGLRFKIL